MRFADNEVICRWPKFQRGKHAQRVGLSRAPNGVRVSTMETKTTIRWFVRLPDRTRLEVIRHARRGLLHPDPAISEASIKWSRLMRPGRARYSCWNWAVVAVETVLAFAGFGRVGEESSVSDRIAAKRIARIADTLT